MNLEHLSSKLRLDMDHLQWEARTQHLSSQQFRDRFNNLAEGYCSLVTDEDLSSVQEMVHHWEDEFHLQ